MKETYTDNDLNNMVNDLARIDVLTDDAIAGKFTPKFLHSGFGPMSQKVAEAFDVLNHKSAVCTDDLNEARETMRLQAEHIRSVAPDLLTFKAIVELLKAEGWEETGQNVMTNKSQGGNNICYGWNMVVASYIAKAGKSA